MIREITSYTLFTADEVRNLPDIPESLVAYVESNKAAFTGQDLLYAPRIDYPDTDLVALNGRQRFRPANIIMSPAPYGPVGVDTDTVIKTIYSIVFEDVDDEVLSESMVLCKREFDKDGNAFYCAEMPAEKEDWWRELSEDTIVGYVWTGVYFMQMYKSDIARVRFIKSTKPMSNSQ